jgi:hypothetical protein
VQLDRDWWNGESEEGEGSTRSESLGSAQVVCGPGFDEGAETLTNTVFNHLDTLLLIGTHIHSCFS